MGDYGFTKTIDEPFERVLERTKEALQKEGFGALCTIDVSAKFREKLNVEFPKYLILGMCSPYHAHKVLSMDPLVGLLLPCNTVVYDKGGKTVVSVIKPTVAMTVADNTDLEPVAGEVEAKLKRAFDAI